MAISYHRYFHIGNGGDLFTQFIELDHIIFMVVETLCLLKKEDKFILNAQCFYALQRALLYLREFQK